MRELPQILLIDDDVAIATALRLRLWAAGYEVTVAATGARGLEIASQCPPQVILLDIRMPEMDGFEVCRRLKADDRLAAVPVVFISAEIADRARAMARHVGAAGYVHKPFEPEQVLCAIEMALDLRGAAEAG